jgi:hypothetical protein
VVLTGLKGGIVTVGCVCVVLTGLKGGIVRVGCVCGADRIERGYCDSGGCVWC